MEIFKYLANLSSTVCDLFIRLNSYVIDAFKLKYASLGSSQFSRKRAIHLYVAEQLT